MLPSIALQTVPDALTETARCTTTFPRLLLEHAQSAPDAPALREKEIRHLADARAGRSWPRLVRDLACGLAAAGLAARRAPGRVGDNRPRLYATMLAAQALGAVPVPLYQDAAAAEFVFPINNAEVAFAIVEDQEQVDKLLEMRAAMPAARRTSGTTTRAACATTTSRAWRRSTR